MLLRQIAHSVGITLLSLALLVTSVSAVNFYIVHGCDDSLGYSPLPYCAGTIQNRQLFKMNAAGTGVDLLVTKNSNVCGAVDINVGTISPQCAYFSGEKLELRQGDIPTPVAPIAPPVEAPVDPPIESPVDPQSAPQSIPATTPIDAPIEGTPEVSPYSAPQDASPPVKTPLPRTPIASSDSSDITSFGIMATIVISSMVLIN